MTRLRLLAVTVGVLSGVLALGFGLTEGAAKAIAPAAVFVVAIVAFVLGGPRPGTGGPLPR